MSPTLIIMLICLALVLLAAAVFIGLYWTYRGVKALVARRSASRGDLP